MTSGIAFAILRDRLPVRVPHRPVLTPNRSLTPRTATLFLAATGGLTFSSIQDSHQQFTVFPRHWAKVKLHAPQHALHPSRLCIESHGRACEVGRFLTEDERRGVAARLRQLIGNVSESPEL